MSVRNGLPLGVYDEAEYTESAITLEAGDLVLVYSDGVTDAMNRGGDVLAATVSKPSWPATSRRRRSPP